MPENEFVILEAKEFLMLDVAGNPVDGYRVYFTWGEGRKGHVDLVKEAATVENRNRLIQAEIERQEVLWG